MPVLSPTPEKDPLQAVDDNIQETDTGESEKMESCLNEKFC